MPLNKDAKNVIIISIMRADEEYAKNSIKRYLENNRDLSVNIVDGEDPPDFWVIEDKKKIALEITTAESIYIEESKKSKRRTVTESVAIFCDELNNEFKKLIPAGKSLMLILKVPVSNFSKFKKQLKIILKKFLQNEIYNKSFNINGEIVEVRMIARDSNNFKAIRGMIRVKKPNINIQEQTRLVLEKILSEKEVKLKKINGKNWNGEKWLGIINNYPLAEYKNFSHALREINNNHGFSKTFIIEDNSEVFEIQKTMN